MRLVERYFVACAVPLVIVPLCDLFGQRADNFDTELRILVYTLEIGYNCIVEVYLDSGLLSIA